MCSSGYHSKVPLQGTTSRYHFKWWTAVTHQCLLVGAGGCVLLWGRLLPSCRLCATKILVPSTPCWQALPRERPARAVCRVMDLGPCLPHSCKPLLCLLHGQASVGL